MAGGNGSKFWPVTRDSLPKQFLPTVDTGKSLLQTTFERFSGLFPKENVLVITIARYENLVREQLPDLPEGNLLLEPYSRNTSPCIAYATYALLKRDPDAVMVAAPSDHRICDEEAFAKTVTGALDYAQKKDVLMTIGIIPHRPDPNYGYIQVEGGKGAVLKDTPVKVKTFTEKPDAPLADVFFKSGEFFWNSGIYIWKASVIKDEMEKYIPEITNLFKGWDNAIGTTAERGFLESAYTDCAKISIDYAVMEKTERAWVFPARFDWSDIDTWNSLYESLPEKDADGNYFDIPKHLSSDNRNCLVMENDKKKLVAVKGLDNYVVVDTADALLICPKDDKSIKDFTAGLAMPDFDNYR